MTNAGTKPYYPTKLSREQRNEVARRYAAGESATQLGKMFNISKVNVIKLAASRKLKRTPASEYDQLIFRMEALLRDINEMLKKEGVI
jgi:hypothetical protein